MPVVLICASDKMSIRLQAVASIYASLDSVPITVVVQLGKQKWQVHCKKAGALLNGRCTAK